MTLYIYIHPCHVCNLVSVMLSAFILFAVAYFVYFLYNRCLMTATFYSANEPLFICAHKMLHFVVYMYVYCGVEAFSFTRSADIFS